MRSMLNKSNQPGGEFWAESLSDGETLVEREDDLDTTSDSQQEGVEEEQVDCIKTTKDVIEGVQIGQITAAIESIKKAKYNDNSGNGLISQNMDFRNAKEERFLFDTGTTACI